MKKYILELHKSAKEALVLLNLNTITQTVCIVNRGGQMVGSLTDGDIRRGLLKGLKIEEEVSAFMNTNFKFIQKNNYTPAKIKHFIEVEKLKLLPLLDDDKKIIKFINLHQKRSLIPAVAILMAGGKGTRLHPLTISVPKPLLKIDNKPIIEYNIDRLNLYGFESITISVNYLADQIKDCFKDGADKNIEIDYLLEPKELGTIGSLSLIKDVQTDYLLIMNSDILTNIDFEDFFEFFIHNNADMVVATIPYEIKIPYAIMDVEEDEVKGFREKPTLSYYTNAGIYFIKKSVIELIPDETFFNATDLMDSVLKEGKKLIHYPIRGYWIDIGQHEEFKKAQEDIKHIIF